MTASESPPTRTAVVTAFTTIYLVWGSTYLAIRVAVETLPPFLMSSGRFLVAGALIAGWLALTRGFKTTPRQWFDNAVVGALLLLGGNGMVSWAEQKIPSGIATLIVSLGPLFIVLLDWAVLALGRDKTQGSQPTLATFLGVGLGLAGLGVLVGPSLGTGTAQLDPWRVGGLVLACLSWSAGSIYTRYARRPAEPFTASAMQLLTGSIWLFLASLLMGEPRQLDLSAISPRSLWAWSYLVVAGSLVGFTTFVWLTKHCSPARVSTYAYVNPVVAVFLGWLVLNEPVSSRVFVGAAIIIAGVATITASKNKESLVIPPRQAIACTEARPAAGR